MSFDLRAAAAALLVFAACAPAPSRVVTGRAVFDGEQDHAGIVVSAPRGGTTTGPDGRFVLTGQPDGPVALVFVAPGSVELTRTAVAEPGAPLPDVVFHPAGAVHGLVLDAATRAPLQGALVLSTGTTAAATSAADGTFTLGGIQSGEATVVVSFSGRGPQQKVVQVRRGQPVDLGPIALAPATDDAITAIAGRVVFADGRPAQAASVRLTAPGLTRETQTGADGRFSFDKLPAGVVRLDFATGAYSARLPAVLLLEGTSGLIAAGGLYPLASNPVELTRGVHLSDLTSGTLSPDGNTLFGVLPTPLGSNLRAVAIDGGAYVDLLKEDELGLSSPSVGAIGLDSSTLAVSLSDPSGSDARQLFLASTVSEGRQLLADRACVVGTLQNTLFFVPGANCRYGGPVLAMPLRFGMAPAAVGTLAGNSLNDLAHLHLFDLVPHGGTSNTYDVDLVTVGPTPGRVRLATNIARTIGVSPDGRHLAYAQTYFSGSNDATLEVVEVATGAVVHLLDHVNVAQLDYTVTGKVAVQQYQGAAWLFDLQTGAGKVFAHDVTSVVVPADGQGAFVFRRAPESELGALSYVSFEGLAETPVASGVLWHRAAPDDTWLYFLEQVELSARRGRLMRVRLRGGPAALVDASVTSGSSSSALPVFSAHGERVAYVRRAGDAFLAVSFDAVKGEAVELAPLEDPATWRWKFSPGGRYLAFDSLLGMPRVLNVQPAAGGAREAVSTDSDLVWRDDRSALFYRYSAKPWTGAAGTWHATFD